MNLNGNPRGVQAGFQNGIKKEPRKGMQKSFKGMHTGIQNGF